jgi:hypothetical protein
MRSGVKGVIGIGLALLLGACGKVHLPIGSPVAQEIPFDASVPRRTPSATHSYLLTTLLPREAIERLAREQLYAYVHVTRCDDGALLAVAEMRLGPIGLMDFDALRQKLREDPAAALRIEGKFSTEAALRSNQACAAFNGGSYLARQASSPPTPIAIMSSRPSESVGEPAAGGGVEVTADLNPGLGQPVPAGDNGGEERFAGRRVDAGSKGVRSEQWIRADPTRW